MNATRRGIAGLLFVLAFASNALSLCADVNGDGQTSAVDALMVLQKGVGQTVPLNCSCTDCGTGNTTPEALAHCADVNGDGNIAAGDALLTLKKGVGEDVPLNCSCEPCGTPTSTTTTTMGSSCLAANALHNRTYIEIYTCAEGPPGEPRYCADTNASDSIKFTHQGNGAYEVRDVPQTGFVYNGTLTCRTFDWNALSPGEYTESGAWTFSSDGATFSGSSTYSALDNSYSGACNTNGAQSPNTPSNPDPVPPCVE